MPAAAIGACALVAGLRDCARRESLTDWRAAVRGAARDSVQDVGGSGLVLLARSFPAAGAEMSVVVMTSAPPSPR
ncbi:hypothetical protein ACFZAV_34770 [Streptomyces sp. NPDC008343]|uniref:hypothetical protein n=1 Tax=Streptomyces sp. NPDC008343 TaxID=3364828 RepID=UPI0036EFE889